MNILSDYEAHKRDEEAFRLPDNVNAVCPTHGCELIAARGYVENGKTITQVFDKPTCPECERLR